MIKSTRITVVESKPLLFNTLSSALENDYEINQIDTAKRCLQSIDTRIDTPMIIVDLFLEDIDGLTLIEEIRLKSPKIPIIGFVCQEQIDSLDIDESAIRIMAKQSGADALFLAPINLGVVVNTIDRLLCLNQSEVA